MHIVGIGGMAMSGIAAVLTRLGHTVSGSDLKAWRGLERLRLLGVEVNVPHDAAALPAELDAVVVSTAIPATNPEVEAARERGVPVLRRAEALAAIVDTRRTVAISGTHGKTTTSTMTTLILRAAGWHPSFLIGGEPNEVGGNAAYDDGDWLVVEADESDGTFLELAPEAAILTNVEADHLDHYGDMATLEAACARYLAGAPGPRVACADDPGAARLAAEVSAAGRPVVTYGEAAGADYRIEGYRGDRSGSRFDLVRRGTAPRGDPPPSPRPAQCPQRRRRRRPVHRDRRSVRRRPGGARPLRRGRPPLPVPRRGRRRHPRRRLRPPPRRDQGHAGRRPGGGLVPGRGRLPAPPLQPHGPPLARLRRRLRRRRRRRPHRRVCRRRIAPARRLGPADPPGGVRGPPPRPGPVPAQAGRPAGPPAGTVPARRSGHHPRGG